MTGKSVQNTMLIKKRRSAPTRGDYITSSFVPIKMNLKLMFRHSEASRKRRRNTYLPECRGSSGANCHSCSMRTICTSEDMSFGGKYWRKKVAFEDMYFPWPFNIFTLRQHLKLRDAGFQNNCMYEITYI